MSTIQTMHTPGPWEIDDGWIIQPASGATICDPRCMEASDPDLVCEMDANAFLIAAAPELLAFLQNLRELGEAGDKDEVYAEARGDSLGALLQKATGGK